MSQDTTKRTQVRSLQVATNLYKFIETKVLPDTGVSSDKFWKGFDAIVQGHNPPDPFAERPDIGVQLRQALRG